MKNKKKLTIILVVSVLLIISILAVLFVIKGDKQYASMDSLEAPKVTEEPSWSEENNF